MDVFAARFYDSFRVSHAEYRRRLASGTQPKPPGWVAGPSSFLDYTDTEALLAVNAAYLLLVLLLYVLMKLRKEAFVLRGPMILYNAVCVALAAYVVYGVVAYKLLKPGTFACNEADLSEAGVELSRVLWVYYAQKFLEFGDTLFFLLRRSFRQLTPLHVYHHVSITLVTAAFLRYDLNGDTYLPALANSLVHVLMYSHYLLSAFGINTWWKKQLTSLQLVQFLIVMAQSVLSLARGRICGFPDWLKLLMVAYQASMLLLFGLFFISSYTANKEAKRARRKAE